MYFLSSRVLVLTFSQPSGGSLAKNLLMCGEVPSLGGSGDDPVLPPARTHYSIFLSHLNQTNYYASFQKKKTTPFLTYNKHVLFSSIMNFKSFTSSSTGRSGKIHNTSDDGRNRATRRWPWGGGTVHGWCLCVDGPRPSSIWTQNLS